MKIRADRNGVHISRLTVSPGCLFLLALGWYLGVGRMLRCCVAAAVLHEGGHLLACFLLWVPVRRFQITCCGGVLETGRPLTGGEEVVVALAGPMMNLLLAFVMLPFGGDPGGAVFLGVNVLLGLFNLLPLLPLDGGRAMHGLFSLFCREEQVEQWLDVVTKVILGFLTVGGVLLGVLGNPSLLLVVLLLRGKEIGGMAKGTGGNVWRRLE